MSSWRHDKKAIMSIIESQEYGIDMVIFTIYCLLMTRWQLNGFKRQRNSYFRCGLRKCFYVVTWLRELKGKRSFVLSASFALVFLLHWIHVVILIGEFGSVIFPSFQSCPFMKKFCRWWFLLLLNFFLPPFFLFWK